MSENIETLQHVTRVIPPPPDIKAHAHIKDYEAAYKQSIEDPERFWDGIAKELHWFAPWKKVLDWQYPWAKWFVDGSCNISYNCLDRHVQTWRKNKVDVIWVGEEGQERVLTYGELYRQVNKCAN
ncbi:MAG: acetyl-coenzyme A synthetase, partial [Nitrospira sp.]|nr:acetyl-coenzyme A synthetase [Nitrospira sp.]